ncbi:serine/threonine-protein kinase [Limnoglobus roseus]|uniref:Serine/threonine protein kinase n=1 Tax=Limnoglobus roseus TaxID=2598579 RepID=A0A5C1AVV5_9BACT|nr:serine/threonine-protein kinase [Limnoglobus roseus]QEL20938.1 serine/threonine protein kinase [Limnoglobus roseus]
MVPTKSPAATLDRPYSKVTGYEPLPGYRIIEPLGRGGFGEVWLCEAPGGLHKAIKFVAGPSEDTSDHSLKQEFEAFQTIKAIRHPFLLTLERVELLKNELVMVMELADAHLEDRYHESQAEGLPGIPRQELLGYLIDAAEALDHISHKYGLQHLDVKPANLFLLSGHVKVGDYGLVARLTAEGGSNPMLNRGMTPKYVAPEVLRGQVHPRSDQYSLALVYQELLTGTFPYVARTAQQMMLAHVSSKPDLTHLPPGDQAIIAKALAKNADDRFPSCLAFVQALITAPVGEPEEEQAPPLIPDSGYSPTTGHQAQQATDRMAKPETLPPGWLPPKPGQGQRPPSLVGVPAGSLAMTRPRGGSSTIPARGAEPLPALRTVERQPQKNPSGTVAAPQTRTAARPQGPNKTLFMEPEPLDLAPAPAAGGVRLPNIRSVVTVSTLLGFDVPQATIWADQIIDSVLAKAAAGGHAPKMPGDVGRRTDGTWVSRFPTTMHSSMLALKCEPMIDAGWFDEVAQTDTHQFALRQYIQAGGLWGRLSGKKSGLEVTINWPTSRGCGEVELLGNLFGTPDAAFVRDSLDVLPKLMAEVRAQLQNVEDRRKTPRLPTNLPVTLYPIGDDGAVLPVINARCRDVSAGGLCCTTAVQPETRYCFAAFEGCGVADGMAVLLRLQRVQPNGYEYVLSGKFRTDL